MIIDLDSHLREGYFLDEVYRLEEPYARYTPVKAGNGRHHQTRFIHALEVGDPRARVCFKHPYMYDPQLDSELAERQVGGYDMERRRQDIRQEGIEKQVIFPTGIGIPTRNVGGLGVALCRAYNTWVRNLVRGYEDVFWPVAMAPAGCPDEMASELRRCIKELGMKAGHLVAYCGPRNLDDPAFYPYYETARFLEQREGRDAALAYFRQLARQEIQWRKGHSLIGQLVVAGEFPLAAELQVHNIERSKAQGAPIDWVALDGVIPVHKIGIALTSTGSRPHAAALFYDFILSRTGMETIKRRHRVPTRPDVTVPYLQPYRLLPFDGQAMDEFDAYVSLFREIFKPGA
ncbi:MAG TPA: amidohydrolase family protein [Methylomirabilota bacterium]|jgi:hypothetical protein|nr:amidohydrolase family protein [Methylomirabilota bacterium]